MRMVTRALRPVAVTPVTWPTGTPGARQAQAPVDAHREERGRERGHDEHRPRQPGVAVRQPHGALPRAPEHEALGVKLPLVAPTSWGSVRSMKPAPSTEPAGCR